MKKRQMIGTGAGACSWPGWHLWLFLLFLVGPMAPLSGNPTNRCILHLDKAFYVPGEVMRYKIYLVPAFKGREATLRASLFGPEGKLVGYHFLRTGGQTSASGHFPLPFDAGSGWYRLLVESVDEQNTRIITLVQAPVPVYDDLSTAGAEEGTAPPVAGSLPASPLPSGDLQVRITLNRDTVRPREQVQLRIQVTDATGRPVQANLSVAVTDEELAGPAALNRYAIVPGPALRPELIGQPADVVFTRGIAFDREGHLLQEGALAAFSARENRVSLANIGTDGTFLLSLPAFYGSNDIQFLGYLEGQEDIRVRLLEDEMPPMPAALPRPEAIHRYLELSRQRKRIYRLFGSVEMAVQTRDSFPSARQLVPDKRFRTDDYESFPDLFTFLREVTTLIYIRKKKEGYSAQMFNPGSQYYQAGRPLFIIDGQATRDVNALAEVPMSRIAQLDFFYQPDQLLGQFLLAGLNGVVAIRTHPPGIEIPEADRRNIFRIDGLQYPLRFPVISPDLPSYQPVFRPQLFWEPSLDTDGKGIAALSFPQSDDLSMFRIEVTAQADDGAMGYGTTRYAVSRK